MADESRSIPAPDLAAAAQRNIVTLLFNVLVTSAPKELSAYVGALRGTANNVAASVGTAVIGTLVSAQDRLFCAGVHRFAVHLPLPQAAG